MKRHAALITFVLSTILFVAAITAPSLTQTTKNGGVTRLDASKITSGTLDAARIPSLDASKITSGTLDAARLPTTAVVGALAYNSSSQSIPDGVFTQLTFDSEARDDGDLHSTSSNTNRIVVPSTGWYQICATVSFASNSTGNRLVFFSSNINGYIGKAGGTAVTGDSTLIQTCVTDYLPANSYVVVQVYQNSGGALNVAGTLFNSRFSVVKLH